MERVKIFQVDAFTSKLFKGNSAAVCPLNNWLDDKMMQSIAMENNLSETSFFMIKENKYYIRWFTPKTEIDLAGHPTLAAAHVIFTEMGKEKNYNEFHTKKGDLLTVSLKNNIFSMNFPSHTVVQDNSKLDEISYALRSKASKFFLGKYGMAIYESEKEIINILPDFEALNALDLDGIIVTAPGENSDFVSRFFAPKFGILEDPVTGSAHCDLIPFWSNVLKKKYMLARQISERGGELKCTHLGDRVIIGGEAITYMKGELFL